MPSQKPSLLFVLVCLLLAPAALFAQQHLGLRLRAELMKEIRFDKKWELEFRQQFQVNPEFEHYRVRYFDDLDFLPLNEEDEDDEDDDDEDDDDEDQNNPGAPEGSRPANELNDSPLRIQADWRSSSSARLQYRLSKRFRLQGAYTFFFEPDDQTHTWRSDLSYDPKLQSRRLDLRLRTSIQHSGEFRRGELRLDHSIVPGGSLEWELNKKNDWFWECSLNFQERRNRWSFDRLRLETGLLYRMTKRSRLEFAYQYQQRLDRRRFSHALNLQYRLEL